MFNTSDLPRNFFTARGRGFHGRFTRANAADEGAAFIFFNPAAALLAERQLLIITRIACSCDDQPASVSVGWSDDSALESITNVLSGSNHASNYLDGATDALTEVAVQEQGALSVTVDATFFGERLGADQPGVLLPLEYPLILPPKRALVLIYDDAPASRSDNCNVGWFRG
jgi:hypothetical protein